MEEIVMIHLRLVGKVTNTPLNGEEYSVRFYDKDFISDDYLGESSLDDRGHAIISLSRNDFRSKDSPFENYPDIFFTVHRNGSIIYKSPLFKNIDIQSAMDYPAANGLHIDLGTFKI